MNKIEKTQIIYNELIRTIKIDPLDKKILFNAITLAFTNIELSELKESIKNDLITNQFMTVTF